MMASAHDPGAAGQRDPDTLKLLRKAYGSLGPTDRRIVREFAAARGERGWTSGIASELHVTTSAVRNRNSRALAKIRDDLRLNHGLEKGLISQLVTAENLEASLRAEPLVDADAEIRGAEDVDDVVSSTDDPRELAAFQCARLADSIGLENGEIRITVSERRAVKIEVQQFLRVTCERRKANEWTKPEEELELVLDGAPEFVMDHLEGLIVSLVGPFGNLEAWIENGIIAQLSLNLSFHPVSRAGRSRRERKARSF